MSRYNEGKKCCRSGEKLLLHFMSIKRWAAVDVFQHVLLLFSFKLDRIVCDIVIRVRKRMKCRIIKALRMTEWLQITDRAVNYVIAVVPGACLISTMQ